MKVKDVLDHFLSRADWLNRERTVDRVIAGDPEADVDRCLVSWMANLKAIRETAARGVPLLVCHEPTYWKHREDWPTEEDPKSLEKQRFIEEQGIAIVRVHDCWDKWPAVGIPFAWAKFLGLGDTPAAVHEKRVQHRYDIEPVTLEEFAHRVAGRCAAIGEPFVQVTGDSEREVSRIGVGTGCCCIIDRYEEIGCDCSIVCDDGSVYWSNIQRAEDAGHPVIRVNHGTSEEPGMVTLTDYINEHIEGVRAEHLPHGSTFRLVGGEEEGRRRL